LTQGNGFYEVEQDWINNANFICGNSTVELYGNDQQFITSDFGVNTTFHNLVLSGNGTLIDKRKTLQNVDCEINSSGTLQLNDRELNTNLQKLIIQNPNPFCVTNVQEYQNEGFVSSLEPGFMQWKTNNGNKYIFPVGSSDGVLRYRPVLLQPNSAEINDYQVRYNNYSSNNDNYFQNQADTGINTLNPLFYHSISRYTESNTKINLGIAYDRGFDGVYTSIAGWHFDENKWKMTNQNSTGQLGNYEIIYSNNWILAHNYKPYILSNYDKEVVVYAPNTFVPDGDGVNDAFEVIFSPELNYKIIDFTVYNRWGEIIHSSAAEAFWDGTYRGLPCQDGTYTWSIKYKDLITNKTHSITGHVNLLK
jgi:gliding motility-associated-like protein